MAEVNEDISLIHEIKDVIDELDIMRVLYKDQLGAIENLGASDSKIKVDEYQYDSPNRATVNDWPDENFTSASMDYEMDAKTGKIRESLASLPKSQVSRSISTVDDMITRAKRAHDAV